MSTIARELGGAFMTAQRSVVLSGAVRTAIGAFGGSLKEMPAPDLGAVVVIGNAVRAGAKMNPGCLTTARAGLPVPAMRVNRVKPAADTGARQQDPGNSGSLAATVIKLLEDADDVIDHDR